LKAGIQVGVVEPKSIAVILSHTDQIIPPPRLVRAELEALPAAIAAPGQTLRTPLHRIFYRDHPQPEHPYGVCAR